MTPSYYFMYSSFYIQQTRKKSFREQEDKPKMQMLPRISANKKNSI